MKGPTFCSILFWRGDFFFYALFCKLFFRESDITCIITVVRAQQQHKGMFLKHGGGEGGGAKVSNSVIGGALFFLPIDFAEPPLPPPPPPPPPAINNECSLNTFIKVNCYIISLDHFGALHHTSIALLLVGSKKNSLGLSDVQKSCHLLNQSTSLDILIAYTLES